MHKYLVFMYKLSIMKYLLMTGVESGFSEVF